jgi:hypothetical protein
MKKLYNYALFIYKSKKILLNVNSNQKEIFLDKKIK